MHRDEDGTIVYHVRERRQTPALGGILAWLAMVPLAVAAMLSITAVPPWPALALRFAGLWSGALLTFFAGVRRGVSFRTEGGPRPGQIVEMLLLFGLGVAALAGPVPWGLLFGLAGFVSMAILDPAAASRGELPAFFARLRPVQMILPVTSLAVLLWAALG